MNAVRARQLYKMFADKFEARLPSNVEIHNFDKSVTDLDKCESGVNEDGGFKEVISESAGSEIECKYVAVFTGGAISPDFFFYDVCGMPCARHYRHSNSYYKIVEQASKTSDILRRCNS